MSEETKPSTDEMPEPAAEPRETTPDATPDDPAVEETAPARAAAADEGETPSADATVDDATVDDATVDDASAADATPADAAPADATPAEAASGEEKPAEAEGEAKAPPNPALYRALRARRPIKGKVEKVIKGGYEIKVPRVRGFCPASQIDVDRVGDPESLVGKTLEFRVIQIRSGGKDVVLSRRALLEASRVEEAKAVRATLIEGAVMQGRVAGIAEFGAFVDLGAGVRGLVHLSELSHARVAKAADAVKEGDTVRVKVLKIDDKRNRISLSMRQAEADPWDGAAEKYAPEGEVRGVVRRHADFGAFVELEPGVEALAPASEFPPSRLGWQTEAPVGEERAWRVISVQPKRRRIALRPADVDAPELKLEPGAELAGRVQKVESFGVFVWLGPGTVGLMPNVLTGAPRGADMQARFPVGEPVEVTLVDIEDGGRKLRLAKKGVDPKAPPGRPRQDGPQRTDDPAFRPRRPQRIEGPPVSDGVKGSFGTSLADKLKAALDGDKR